MSTVANVQSYLVQAGLIDGSTDWPSVRRRVFDDLGAKLVVLTEDGGGAPSLQAPQGMMGDAALADPAVQVLVRGDPWRSDEAQDQALAIQRVLHGQREVLMGDVIYLRVLAQSSEPIFIGFDENNRPMFTQSYRCAVSVNDQLAVSS